MTTLKYHDIKEIVFWVAPDSGGSLIISPITLAGREIKILITQIVDLENFLPDMIPGRIYIDDILIELKSKEEASVLTLLSNMIRDNRLGHKQGLAVIRAKETIVFFNSQEAEKIKRILNQWAYRNKQLEKTICS